MNRETVGKISSDLIQKEPETRSPIEQMQENLTDYDRNIHQAIDTGKKAFFNDFYIVVITKKEPLMPNVIRNYFLTRLTCPTPDYDQTVYRYYRKDDLFAFLWVIPSTDACIYLKNNALHVKESERDLLNFVLEFADGSLFKLSKKLNEEKEESSEIEKE